MQALAAGQLWGRTEDERGKHGRVGEWRCDQRERAADDGRAQAGLSWRHRRPVPSRTTHPDRGPRTSSVRSGPAGARTAYATTALTIWVLARPADLTAPDGPKVRCKRLQPGSSGAGLRISAVSAGGLVSEGHQRERERRQT